jgi:D-tyrosyl-tRNA(Tyr) deacylase
MQRVRWAKVSVDGAAVAQIGPGIVVLVGVTHRDTAAEAAWLAAKVAGLRIFADDAGKMNRSVTDVGGSVLAVSQFTLYADCRTGRRPSFDAAAPAAQAQALWEEFVGHLRALNVPVACGVFQAHMLVELANDGPVTLVVDTAERARG